MPWFRLDDSFHSHPKVIAAGNEAIGLYVRCGTYAAEHLTDGLVPKDVVLLYGSTALADELVRVKLWRRTRGGWTIHDYLDYNPSREAVENERKNATERQRRRRDHMLSRRDSQRDTDVTHTTPTRPVKDPPSPPQAGGSGHDGQHKHCRACGTSQRGPAPLPKPTPAPPPFSEAHPVNGHPIRGPAVEAIAAQARQAITREDT
jgi:hypothetical protein